MKKGIKTISEAISIIKELQLVCKKQRELIKKLEGKLGSSYSRPPAADDQLNTFANFIKNI